MQTLSHKRDPGFRWLFHLIDHLITSISQSNIPIFRYSTFFCTFLSMKSLYFLVGVLPLLSLAAETCQCPLVKCGGTEAEVRSMSFFSLSSQISPRTRCLHSASINLPMLTPIQICKCMNNAAISCYQKCGGPYPVLKVSQHLIFSPPSTIAQFSPKANHFVPLVSHVPPAKAVVVGVCPPALPPRPASTTLQSRAATRPPIALVFVLD